MRSKTFITILFLIVSVDCFCQVSLKTEYMGSSQYWHEIDGEGREKVNNSKGSARIYQANIQLPLSIKISKDSMPTMWAIAAGGSYTQLDNRNFTEEMPTEIMNLQAGLIYLRPLSKKWSSLFIVGGGVFAPSSNFNSIKFKHLLGNIGVTFIRHLKPNLEIGGGLAINSTFGYPMIFPSFYFDWRNSKDDFAVNVSMMNGFEIEAGYKVNKHFNLNLTTEVNGQLALLEKNNKDVMFTHQYITTGLSPEIIVDKHFSISLSAGINAFRPAYYNERSLKGMFTGDSGYHFGVSPHFSASLVIN